MGTSAAHPQTPDPAPWIRVSPHFCDLMAHIGEPGGAASQSVTKSRAFELAASSMVIGPLPPHASPVTQALGLESLGVRTACSVACLYPFLRFGPGWPAALSSYQPRRSSPR